jgi:hypothetical protein
MKLMVETVGNIMLMLPSLKVEIPWNRPAVVPSTGLIMNQVAIRQLVILFELPDEATEAEWVEWLNECDGDTKLAIESYKAKYREPVAQLPLFPPNGG